MKRLLNILRVGAIASVLAACSDDPAVPADPCATPPEISEVKITHSSCGGPGGSVSAKAEGGNGNFLFSLEGKEFQAEGQFENIPAGTYTLTVKDEQDCSKSQEIVINETNNLILNIASVAHSGCETSEGQVHLSAAGGAENYTYSLDGVSYQSGTAFNNLAAGTFTAFVKDEAGCVSGNDFVVRSGVSYKTEVKSIITTNCAIAGCHVAGTGRSNLELFSQVQKNAETILNYTKSGFMPAAGSGKKLTASEIEMISCWVNDGAPEN